MRVVSRSFDHLSAHKREIAQLFPSLSVCYEQKHCENAEGPTGQVPVGPLRSAVGRALSADRWSSLFNICTLFSHP